MHMRIAIVDDDKDFLKNFKELLEGELNKWGMEYRIYSFKGSESIIEDGGDFDLYFMDIDMPRIDGLELAAKIRKEKGMKPEIIFVTSLDNKVYDAFCYRIFGFVRKLDLISDLTDTVKLLAKCMKTEDFCTFDTREGLVKFKLSDIMHFESARHVITLYTQERGYELRKETLALLMTKLKDKGFYQVHKGYIVNCEYIKSILRDRIIMDNGLTIPVSKRRLDEIREAYIALCSEGEYICV